MYVKKKFYLGINAGGGIGWRINKNVPDSMVFAKIDSKGEEPEFSYYAGFSFAYSFKNWGVQTGIEYSYIAYANNNFSFYINRNYPSLPYDSLLIKADYEYKHQLISLPIKFNRFINRKQWVIGLSIKGSWLSKYGYNKLKPTGKFATKNSNNIVFFSEIAIGKKVFETTRLICYLNCNVQFSTKVGGQYTETSLYNSDKLKSMPHNLLVPSLEINLQYKL